MLETLDTYLRLLIIGQLSMLGVVMWVRERIPLGLASVALVLSFCGYLVSSSDVLSSALVLLDPLLVGLAIAVPYVVWWFAAIVFEFRLPHRAWLVLPVIALLNWLVYLSPDLSPDLAPGGAKPYEAIVGIGARVASLIVVAHILYCVLVDRRDDLLEPRRRFRALFVGLVAGFVFSTVIVELYLMGPAPMWLQLTSATLIGVLTLGLGLPLLLGGDWFAAQPAAPKPAEPETLNEPLRTVLLDAMANRVYAEPGLTITTLATQLGAPEHELRRLINRTLGYRNFSTFVNGYRIQEAAERLRNPDEARLPVLTIALDVGFGSIGPFNRAFKQEMKTTPTAYRGGETQNL